MRTILTVTLAVGLLGCAGDQPQADSTGAETPSAPYADARSQPTQSKTVTAPAPPPPPPVADPDALKLVRGYTQMFYRGELDLLHQKFTDEMRKTLTLDQLSALYEQVITDFGKETRVVGEDSQQNEEYRAFVRWARFDKTDEVIEVQWILRQDSDQIAGFFVRPARRKIKVEGQ